MPSGGHSPRLPRVFFGHQSVGTDLLKGISELPRTGALHPIALTRRPAEHEALLAHDFVGHNGEPLTKIADFAKAIEGGIGDWADLALLKFCYVDIVAVEQVQIVFDAYVATIGRLAAAFPRLAFGHITVPLRRLGTGMADLARRFVHGGDPELARNAARDAYNELLRDRFGTETRLFDLARIESEDSAGRPVGRRLKGRFVPALAPEYTDDGGHLNILGRQRVATQFVAYLARVSQPP